MLQARLPVDSVGAHERLCFHESLGIHPTDLIPYGRLAGPPAAEVLPAADCVLVCGSGEFSCAETTTAPWSTGFIDFIERRVEQGVPTFASCFGFQAVELALGPAQE